ncbi:hypothetical protein HK405_009733, partial [Cladochytrium tenue]
LVEVVSAFLDRHDLLSFIYCSPRILQTFRSPSFAAFFRRRVLEACHAPLNPVDLFDRALVASLEGRPTTPSYAIAAAAVSSFHWPLSPHPRLVRRTALRPSGELLSGSSPIGVDWLNAHLATDFLCVFCLSVPAAGAGAGVADLFDRAAGLDMVIALAAAATTDVGGGGWVAMAPPGVPRTGGPAGAGLSGGGCWSVDTGLLSCSECQCRYYCNDCDAAKRPCRASKARCLRRTMCPACYDASYPHCASCGDPLDSCARCSIAATAQPPTVAPAALAAPPPLERDSPPEVVTSSSSTTDKCSTTAQAWAAAWRSTVVRDADADVGNDDGSVFGVERRRRRGTRGRRRLLSQMHAPPNFCSDTCRLRAGLDRSDG